MDDPTMESESKEYSFNTQKVESDCILSVTGRMHSQVVDESFDKSTVSGKRKILLCQLFWCNEFVQGTLIKGDFCSLCSKEDTAAPSLR